MKDENFAIFILPTVRTPVVAWHLGSNCFFIHLSDASLLSLLHFNFQRPPLPPGTELGQGGGGVCLQCRSGCLPGPPCQLQSQLSQSPLSQLPLAQLFFSFQNFVAPILCPYGFMPLKKQNKP